MKNKITSKQRAYLQDIQENAIRPDHITRYRNALGALASLDPKWMIWVEREIDVAMPLSYNMRLIEARARTLLLARYAFFHYQKIGWIIFREDQPFNENGNLVPG